MSAPPHHISGNYTSMNHASLIKGGKLLFDRLLQCIAESRQHIHLQVYIFNDDSTGRMVIEALKAAVQRGVAVYLMADGYASQKLRRRVVRELKAAGIQFRFFEPIVKSKYFYFGRRLHHKVFVFDGTVALVGGINIADRYNDLPGLPAWLDYAMEVKGEIAQKLCVLCWKTWKGFPIKMDLTPCETSPHVWDIAAPDKMNVRMRRNDWVRRKNEISASYVQMFRHAEKEITILCSYFLPGKFIRKMLAQAASRGVLVRVITAGRSDIVLAKHAERWLYDWLLRNKIELYEYQPSILHAKLAVCDKTWMTIGSYNLNNISAYASIELNIDVHDQPLASETQAMLERLIENDCLSVTPAVHFQKKNPIKQLLRWISYHFIRTVVYLLTFYYTRKK